MSNNSMTSEPTTPNHIQLQFSQVVFHANQFQTTGVEKGLRRLQNLGYGSSYIGLFCSYDLDTSYWKTSQQSLTTGLELYLDKWPRQALIANMHAYQLPLLEPPTKETDGFVFASDGMLPTPTASMWKGVGKRGSKSSLSFARKGYLAGVINETCFPQSGEATYLNPSFCEELMGFPLGWTELKD